MNVSIDLGDVQLQNTARHDVGLMEPSYYNNRLNPVIAAIRNLLLPLVKAETSFLKLIQSFHTPILTWYFLISANLGSHTFYVLMLPLPVWLGSVHLTRDLVIVLGLGIYFTGFVKDLLCLPRPVSPPLKRLTMSHYTSAEYGCPSSHSANAIGVSLVLSLHIHHSNMIENYKFILYILLTFYCLTMVIGRLYCGMHGLVDITIGSLIGVSVFLFRYSTIFYHDYMVLNNDSILVPIVLISIYYSLIYFHPTPIDACPCFEDSIAFIAVLMGLSLGYWSFTFLNGPIVSSVIPKFTNNSIFSKYSKLGYIYLNHSSTTKPTTNPLHILLRILVGIIVVLLWKSISKPLFTFIISSLRKPSSNGNQKCTVYAFMDRNDTRILVKYIVYAGIAVVALYTKCIFELLSI